jgi:hypothetical protein
VSGERTLTGHPMAGASKVPPGGAMCGSNLPRRSDWSGGGVMELHVKTPIDGAYDATEAALHRAAESWLRI